MQYGIGTYIRELTGALLKHTDINMYLVSYMNREVNEFTVVNVSPRYSEITVPAPRNLTLQDNKSDKKYAGAVVNLLSGVIPENGEVVFQMNYIDDLAIIEKLKKTYSYPVISVVHFAQWQQLFMANKQKLKGLDIDNPSNNIEFTLNREKKMYELSDHVVSVTRYMKDFLVDRYGIEPDKITVIPNGLHIATIQETTKEEKSRLKSELGIGIDEKVIVFSGRVDKCKGISFLIEAFLEATKYRDNLRLVVIGQGDIQDCLKKTGFSYGKITYTGFIPSDKVTDFYKIADVGVVPSIYDHCPYTVLEMMSHKLPLILSRINGLDEILEDGQCLFVDPIVREDGELSFDINEIAKSILFVIDNEDKAKAMTGDYPELMRTRFSTKRMATELYAVLENLYETVTT
jgi:glycosyltransferase involved in cell wall biosynthesis